MYFKIGGGGGGHCTCLDSECQIHNADKHTPRQLAMSMRV